MPAGRAWRARGRRAWRASPSRPARACQGEETREPVSSLESLCLSWELSVGNCGSCKMKGPALWPESLSYYGKACLCTGDIFPWIPGEITQQLLTPHAGALAHPNFCAAPSWAPGSCGLGCSRGNEANPEFLSGRTRLGGEPVSPARETWLPRDLPGLRR